jgi:hypothetical protein
MDYKDDFVWREKQTSIEYQDAPPHSDIEMVTIITDNGDVFVMPYSDGYQAIPRITFKRTLYIEDDAVVNAKTEVLDGGFWVLPLGENEFSVVVFETANHSAGITDGIRNRIKSILDL